MGQTIDYGNLMHDAMRGLIRKVLQDVADNGLPGAHHFFITFDTGHPDAELADWLFDRYPGEMTVVMQQWYDNLEVSDEGFAITLNFGDAPEPLYIPYDAVKTFVDPSVEFGLRFETQEDMDDSDSADTSHAQLVPTEAEARDEAAPTDVPDATPAEAAPQKAEVVSLDSFRK